MTESNQNLFDLSDEELLNMGSAPEVDHINEDVEEDIEDLEDHDDEDSQEYPEGSYHDDDEDEEDFEEDFDDSVYEEEDFDNRNDFEEEDNQEKASNEKDEETSVDYKAVYEAIFKPFKANGKEIQVKSVEDVISLMQMGANYTKKMTGIKDKLPILKMLENNNLLDEDRLSYAIDLLNGDTNAIGKLIKEHDIDTYDIDDDDVEKYTPSDKRVSHQEIALTDTLDELRESKNFNKTMQIVTEDWDDESKKAVFNEPEILKVIDQHLENGIYQIIQDEVERLQALNQLSSSISSLHAYKLVGDKLNEEGAFNYLNEEQSKPTKPIEADNKVARKRKSAQRVRNTSSNHKQSNNNIDPLNLSDEEFQKLAGMNEYI